MAKVQFNCRLREEVRLLIKSEVVRLTAETGQKVTEADVVEMAVVRWCSDDGAPMGNIQQNEGSPDGVDRRAVAEAAMHGAEAGSVPGPVAPKVNPRAESVAQRRAREAKEHAEKLAESDVVARLTGRDDIEYDLENVPHRSVAAGPGTSTGKDPAPIYIQESKSVKREFKPLTRPHGGTEAKRKREQ